MPKFPDLAKLKAFAKLQRARALASRGKHSAALAAFEGYFSLLGGDGRPSTKATPDINVLYALEALKASEEQKAFKACEVTFHQLDAAKYIWLSEGDLKYLSIITKYILLNLTGHLAVSAIGLASQFDQRLLEVDLAAVTPRLLRIFPIPGELVDAIRDYENKLAQ